MMRETEPQVTDAGRYPVGRAAELLGVSRSTITRWVTSGRINCGWNRVNCKKFITGAEIKRVWREQY